MGNEFTELIESFTAAEASIQNLFNRDQDGVGIRTIVSRGGPKYTARLTEAAQFIGAVFDGKRPMWQLREALSTDDFPLLFGDTIDRMLLAKYRAVTPDWQSYVKVSRTIRDFRAVKRFRCSIGRGMTDEVPAGGDYQADAQTETSYQFAVKKFGRRRDILWETLQNDDLGALQDTPDDLAKQAINREAQYVTSLFAANTTLFGNHTVNGVVYANKSTAPFSATNLATALGVIGTFPGDDDDGTPIMNDPVYIVVGTKKKVLEVEQVLNSLVVYYSGGSEQDNLPSANIISRELASRLKVVYNPYLRMVDPTNYANSWYLFADPGDGWAVEVGYLSGHDAPELYMKAANQIRLGGGAAIEGDFDTDARSYKVLHVIGGSHTNAVGGWRFGYWSDGSGV
jgi:hypothetical protein